MKGIYLDNSMITRPSTRALAKMVPFFQDRWGFPSAPHQQGQEVVPAIRESLQSLYNLLGAKEKDTILFTSSGAEAINQVILSAYTDTTLPTGKNQFITSTIDEAPTMMAISRQEQMGCVAKMVTPTNGIITADAVADAMTPRTALVSLSWANGLTGTINPVGEIASLCQERGVLFHLDASHVLGKLFFSLEDIGADFISWNGDHIHAPSGTGALYIKHGVKCSPLIAGGLEQGGLRAGSYSVAGLAALGEAAREALDSRDLLCTEVARLRDLLETKIFKNCPEAKPFYRDQSRLPHCTTIAFPTIANEALLYRLNRKKIFACIGGGSFQQIKLILEASGIDPILAQTAVSFSLSRETTEEDINQASDVIADIVRQLAGGIDDS